MTEEKARALSLCMLDFNQIYNEKVSRRFRPMHSDMLSPVQLLLLGIIAGQKRITMGELGERALMQKQQVTKVVNQLEEKHLVVRTRPDTNRRIVQLDVTDEAHALLCDIHKAIQAEMTRIFGQLDEQALDEYIAAITAANRILSALKPDDKGAK